MVGVEQTAQPAQSSSTGIDRIIDDPGYLVVSLSATRLFVYRSVMVKDSSSLYLPVLALIGDTPPLDSMVISDPGMLFGHAELAIYALSEVGSAVHEMMGDVTNYS